MVGSVEEVLARFDAALDELASIDARELDVDEVGAFAVAMQQRLARVDAVATHAAGAFDANGNTENASSASAWLAYRARLPKWKAKQTISRARSLRRMHGVDAAFSAGEINGEHIGMMAKAFAVNPEAFDKVESELLDDAKRVRFDTFCRRVAYWRQIAAPDTVEDEAETVHRNRNLYASKTMGGTVAIDGTMEPVGGDIWLTELNRLADLLFQDDWRVAKERLGRTPLVHELDRTPAQRRHDALVLMAERSAAMPAGATPARPLITVLVGYETFAGRICELADGTVLTPGQVVSLLDDADVRRVVFGSPSRVLDVSARKRLFEGADRIAVLLRDLECQGDPSCDVRFQHTEVDHVEPYAWGGATVQANGSAKCRWHHRRRRRGP